MKKKIVGLTCIEYVPPGVIGAGSCEPSRLACGETMFKGVQNGGSGIGETRIFFADDARVREIR